MQRKLLHRIFHWQHKYFGLIVLLFLCWMSISGILLNHPALIQSVSVSKWLVPGHYKIQNWSRGALTGTVQYNDSLIFIYGSQGVFKSGNRGKTFEPFMNGDFPVSAWNKRTNHLLPDTNSNRLIASCYNGLYVCSLDSGKWQQLLTGHHIRKTILLNDTLYIFSKSQFFKAPLSQLNTISDISPAKFSTEQKVSLITVFFELHDGSILGMPGRILWDIVALIMLFLCISAFYIWFYPEKWKRNRQYINLVKLTTEKRRYRFHFKNHKRLGWYFFAILLIIVVTGTFLRPPLLIALANAYISKSVYLSVENGNPWHNKINNALYDSYNKRFIIECTDGIWAGNLNPESQFWKINFRAPIFAMGTTVFEEIERETFLVGSFGGLFKYNMESQKSLSLLNISNTSQRGRPATVMVSGLIRTNGDSLLIADQYKGICDLSGKPQPGYYKMPGYLSDEFKMPLWSYMFEIHNGRFFKGILGGFHMLIAPLGGLLTFLVLISGIIDYWIIRVKK